jgi:cyclohexanone monooxygenase
MVSQAQSAPVSQQSTQHFDAIVIGAGFAGMYMLHRLRELKLHVRVYESASDVGGTWYWNRYPGARCDSPSMHYSYSFSPELEQEWEWSERFPAQPEILRYLSHVADRFDLRRDIQFNTRIESAQFDEANNLWRIRTANGEEVTAAFCITAVGCLSVPNQPDMPGLDRFQGQVYHTGLWPHEGVDFTGLRVGVIGTGSSAIQAIPVIAEQAAHLTVFQRTPNYIAPARNRPLSAQEQAQTKARYREIRQADRDSYSGLSSFPLVRNKSALDATPQERREVFEEAWQIGGFSILGAFNDLTSNIDSNQHAAEFIRDKIREIVHDPETARLLSPTDYPFATKRLPVDTNYFATYNRPNVRLVDIRNAPIEEITANGLRTSQEQFELDVLVFATGFDAMTGPLLKIDFRGRNDLSLRQKWAEGPRTYLGIQSHSFPNLFMITAPGSPSVLTNMPVAIEQHVEWISDCIAFMRQNDLSSIEAKQAAEEQWVEHVNQEADKTLFPLANSWYLGANIPGKPRIFMPYTGGLNNYRKLCDEIAAKGYEGFQFQI